MTKFYTSALLTALAVSTVTAGEYDPLVTTDIITDPTGVVQTSVSTASGYRNEETVPVPFFDEQSITEIVFGDNDEVFFFNLIPDGGMRSYVKGVRTDTSVTIQLPQTVGMAPERDCAINLTVLKLQAIGDDPQYVIDSEKTTVTFNIEEDGTLTLESLGDGGLLGYVFTDDSVWTKSGAWKLSIAPMTEKPVTPPAGRQPEEWNMITGDTGHKVKVVATDEAMYIGGISPAVPDMWVKGLISPDDSGNVQLLIPSHQYLGDFKGFVVRLKFIDILGKNEWGHLDYEMYPEGYSYVMNFDPEAGMLTAADPEVAMVFNASEETLLYLDYYQDLMFKQPGDEEGYVPRSPYDLQYEVDPYWNEGTFTFYVPTISTTGTLLDPDNLYYKVYIDDVVHTFYSTLYWVPETCTEVPFNVSTGYINMNGSCRTIAALDFGQFDRIGVQSVYYHDGVAYDSEYVEIDTSDTSVGLTEASAGKDIDTVTYFDLTGRIVANPSGVCIVKRTLTDGTVRTSKVIR